MMILYVCPQCGRWQDVSLGAAIVTAVNNTFAKMRVPTYEDDGVPCPSGRHGLMHMVTSDDRLEVWKPWNQETDHVAINTEPTPETTPETQTARSLSLVERTGD